MRLIDADALIDDLKHDVAIDEDSLCYEDLTDINRANIQNDKDIKQNAIDLLNHAPTIEERKTGRWIHREDMDFLDENKVEHIHFMCSECGLIHDFLDWHTAQYNYCPNCGAKMEVEHE